MPRQQCNLCYCLAENRNRFKKISSISHNRLIMWKFGTKDIWQGSLEWLEEGFYLPENLEEKSQGMRKKSDS